MRSKADKGRTTWTTYRYGTVRKQSCNVVQLKPAHNLLIVAGSLSGKKGKFLVDSGASSNFIDMSFLSQKEQEECSKIYGSVHLADGMRIKLYGTLERTLKLGAYTLTVLMLSWEKLG